MHQHLLLGRWFRSRYDHLLSDSYSLHDIYIQSTDVDRTLMSAEANLAGLYPPKGNQVWDALNWMPIPVHTIPETEDSLLAAKKLCPRYNYEYSQLLQSPKFKKIDLDNAKLYKYLTKNTGRKIDSLQQLEYLYDCLRIEVRYNEIESEIMILKESLIAYTSGAR